MEEVRAVIEKVRNQIRSTKEPTKYKCPVCQKALSQDEIQDAFEASISPPCCSKCLQSILSERRVKRLRALQDNITAELSLRNVPPRYLNYSLDNFKPVGKRKEYLKVARDYTENCLSGEGLFLTGPNGTGKSHLAVGILRALVLQGATDSYFIKIPDLLMRIRKAIREEFSSEEQVIEKFVRYEYLVLDELGAEKSTPWSLQTLYLIVDGRSVRYQSTVITSNLDLDEIAENLDPRLSSRIIEMCRSVRMDCEDWRYLSRTQEMKRKKEGRNEQEKMSHLR